MSLPPGPRYLLHHLPYILAPPALVYLSARIARTTLEVPTPAWLLGILAVLSWPVAFTLWIQWQDFTNAVDARGRGAAIPPSVKSRKLGGLDIISTMNKSGRGRYLAESVYRWAEQYGNTFNFRVMFEDRIFTVEPEYIKLILATDFNHYEKGSVINQQLGTLLGQGVFNSDGQMWKFHRSMTRPFFARDRITHFDIFDSHAEHALDKVAARLREGYPVDWQDVISRFTMDSATEFLFGKDVRSLDSVLPYPSSAPAHLAAGAAATPADRFVRAFQRALEGTATRGKFLQLWPLFEFWKDKVKPHMAAVDAFIDPIVQDAISKHRAGKSALRTVNTAGVEEGEEKVQDDDEEAETLLDHLVKFTDDSQVIKDETLNILLAGRDTTACTLTFAVYRLAQHPDVLRRLRAEVLEKVGPSARPTYDQIKEMKYMRAFLNEVLRLYPAVPVNARSTIEPAVWKSLTPGGRDWYIPKGARLLYSVLIMHRRKDLWGPDALSFDPDRFLDARLQKYLLANPFIFLPFNAGPRICLGQQFAYNEMSLLLVRLLQRFSEITLRQEAHPSSVVSQGIVESPMSDGTERVNVRAHLTAYAKNGVWVEMKEVVAE